MSGPSHPAGPAPSAQSETIKVCQPEKPQAQSLTRLLACLTCLRLASGPAQPATRKEALPIQQPAQAQLSPARPAQVPGATSSVVRLPGSQQPTHGFAASWLRLASGPAQSSPGPGASQGMPATTAPIPAHQQAQPSVPRSGLSNVSEKLCQLLSSPDCPGPSPSARLLAFLRVCDWPQAQPSQQLATQPQPVQQPAQAQLSPGATNGFASWLRLSLS